MWLTVEHMPAEKPESALSSADQTTQVKDQQMTGLTRSTSYRTGVAAVSGAAAVSLFAAGLVTLATSAQAAEDVPLGTTESFVILAGAGITNTGLTTLDGDIGTFPTTSIDPGAFGFTFITGTNHAGDGVTQGAKDDLVLAYNAAAGQPDPVPIADDLGGDVLTAGVYNSASSIGLNGTVTLDAQGDEDAVFVFQAGSTLITETGSTVALTNGAQACNVYWQVGSSATLKTTTTFVGTIFALESISLQTGATVDGRVLARNGAVTLDTNTITRPECDDVVPTDEPTDEPTDTPTDEPTDEPTNTPPTGGAPGDTPSNSPPPVNNPPVDSPPPAGSPGGPPVDSPPPAGSPGGPPPGPQVKTPPKGSVDAGSFARG